MNCLTISSKKIHKNAHNFRYNIKAYGRKKLSIRKALSQSFNRQTKDNSFNVFKSQLECNDVYGVANQNIVSIDITKRKRNSLKDIRVLATSCVKAVKHKENTGFSLRSKVNSFRRQQAFSKHNTRNSYTDNSVCHSNNKPPQEFIIDLNEHYYKLCLETVASKIKRVEELSLEKRHNSKKMLEYENTLRRTATKFKDKSVQFETISELPNINSKHKKGDSGNWSANTALESNI